jgi:GTPase involved in cell partitioning and DNA repair
MHDLSHLRMRTVEGVDGQSGGSTGRQGKNGGKTLLRVPCGTLVFELKTE